MAAVLLQSPLAESKLEPLMLCLLGAYSDPPLFSNTLAFVATHNMAFQQLKVPIYFYLIQCSDG